MTGLPNGDRQWGRIKITSNFELIVDVFVSGKTSQKISVVTLSVADVRIRLHGAKNEIIGDKATFDFVPRASYPRRMRTKSWQRRRLTATRHLVSRD